MIAKYYAISHLHKIWSYNNCLSSRTFIVAQEQNSRISRNKKEFQALSMICILTTIKIQVLFQVFLKMGNQLGTLLN